MQFKLDRSLRPDRPLLPEWTRWAWASVDEQQYWQHSISKAVIAWSKVEIETVKLGHRQATFQYVEANKLIEYMRWAAIEGLQVVPYSVVNQSNTYLSGSSTFDPRKPVSYRVLLCNKSLDADWMIKNPDILKSDDYLGQILGYPECCRHFFDETWGKGQVDTTWDQYASTGEANGPIYNNLLWRFLGIRWVSHLPCSYTCRYSGTIGMGNRSVMRSELGLVEEADTIDRILNWKTSWSSVNGIAEIVGPAVKVSTRTDWAPPSANRRFVRQGQTSIPWIYIKPTEANWKLNGFGSYEAMYDSHSPVIDTIKEFVPQSSLVFDLGCGTGALLRRLRIHRSDYTIGGVDINEAATKVARQTGLAPQSPLWFTDTIQNMFEKPENLKRLQEFNHTRALVYSPVRLLEIPEPERQSLIDKMLKISDIHIVYTYADNNAKKTLQEWVADAGLPTDRLLVTTFDNPVVSVGVLRLGK